MSIEDVLDDEYSKALDRYLKAHAGYFMSTTIADRSYEIEELRDAVEELSGVHWEESREDLEQMPLDYAELALKAKFAFRRFDSRRPETFDELDRCLAAVAANQHHELFKDDSDFLMLASRLREARASWRVQMAEASRDETEKTAAREEQRAAMMESLAIMGRAMNHGADVPLNIQVPKWLKPPGFVE